jgi:hypothetical protein
MGIAEIVQWDMLTCGTSVLYDKSAFPKWSILNTRKWCIGKDSLKVHNSLVSLQELKKFTNGVWDFILHLTLKKWPPVKFWYSIKEEQSQLSEKIIKILYFPIVYTNFATGRYSIILSGITNNHIITMVNYPSVVSSLINRLK